MIRFEWVLPEGEAPGAHEELRAAGVDPFEPKVWEPDDEALDDAADAAFEPMMILAFSLGASALIKVISDVVVKHRYPGGDLFDLRGGGLIRRPVPRLPQGTMVFLTDEGTQVFEPAQREDGMGRLAQAIGAMGSACG